MKCAQRDSMLHSFQLIDLAEDERYVGVKIGSLCYLEGAQKCNKYAKIVNKEWGLLCNEISESIPENCAICRFI
jgi:hypothetical protein